MRPTDGARRRRDRPGSPGNGRAKGSPAGPGAATKQIAARNARCGCRACGWTRSPGRKTTATGRPRHGLGALGRVQRQAVRRRTRSSSRAYRTPRAGPDLGVDRSPYPAPPLGPPTAHLGESIIAWALEVRWDMPLGHDPFVAAHLPLAQHPDLLRAGVGKQGGIRCSTGVSIGDATIGVTRRCRLRPDEMIVSVALALRPQRAGRRIELHRRTNAPNGEEGIIATVPVSSADLASGRPKRTFWFRRARRHRSTERGCNSTTSSGCWSTAASGAMRRSSGRSRSSDRLHGRSGTSAAVTRRSQ